MQKLLGPVSAAFETAHFNVTLQLGDLSDEDARRRARGEAGASISWIVGHLLSFRCTALKGCGVDRPNPYAETFAFDKPATDGAGYPQIAELRQDWNDVHGQLIERLADLDEARLEAPSGLFGPFAEKTLLEALAFISWHEAYHVGAIGSLRVQWGYRHTHELAMEAMGRAG